MSFQRKNPQSEPFSDVSNFLIVIASAFSLDIIKWLKLYSKYCFIKIPETQKLKPPPPRNLMKNFCHAVINKLAN